MVNNTVATLEFTHCIAVFGSMFASISAPALVRSELLLSHFQVATLDMLSLTASIHVGYGAS